MKATATLFLTLLGIVSAGCELPGDPLSPAASGTLSGVRY
jgi:hypothetical protein